MQAPQPYIEFANCWGHTVDAGNLGGTNAANDCVLAFTVNTQRGFGIEYIGDAAVGSIWRLFRKGVYRLDVYCDIVAHADTDLTVGITFGTDAAGLMNTPTNATVGLMGRILRKTLPAATGITEAWHFGDTFDCTDLAAGTVNVGSADPGMLVRVILTGSAANTHPTANVVGTAANWWYRLTRLGDRLG